MTPQETPANSLAAYRASTASDRPGLLMDEPLSPERMAEIEEFAQVRLILIGDEICEYARELERDRNDLLSEIRRIRALSTKAKDNE